MSFKNRTVQNTPGKLVRKSAVVYRFHTAKT